MGNNSLERFESMVLRGIENEEAETFGITLRRVSEVATTPLSRRGWPDYYIPCKYCPLASMIDELHANILFNILQGGRTLLLRTRFLLLMWENGW